MNLQTAVKKGKRPHLDVYVVALLFGSQLSTVDKKRKNNSSCRIKFSKSEPVNFTILFTKAFCKLQSEFI
jgi:hypothetical protein